MMEAGRRSLPFVKRKLSRKRQKLTTTEGDYDFIRPTSKSLSQQTSRRRSHKRNPPPLPKEDFSIIVRPFQGLPIREITAPKIAEAVVNACQGTISGSQFLLWLKPGSNIFIISIPNQDVADITRKIPSLALNERLHPVDDYSAVGDHIRKGVIYGLTPNRSLETLLANLRIRTKEVEILKARMLRETNPAVNTFFGPITSRFV
ncbi:hypothetical protein HPB51_008448 [Rhipicephalus microplus]|uniref:Uncharacterized protein n=1 Tax=Rhipicephalus microplus TaxID=6941 RepID=A0A9J6EZ55_RHIMP|nr:hypothetical protein HPB51_008448 [Rhipicephalus microplus]